MKEAWHLAASDAAASASQIVNLHAKRWTIEPGFRDTKDLRFGMGMSVLRIGDPQWRDRLLLLNALAILLLTLLGAAGESLGMDRSLRTSRVGRGVDVGAIRRTQMKCMSERHNRAVVGINLRVSRSAILKSLLIDGLGLARTWPEILRSNGGRRLLSAIAC